MKICLKFTSKQDRDEWLKDNGCAAMAFAPNGEPTRFLSAWYELQTPKNDLLTLTGEYGPR